MRNNGYVAQAKTVPTVPGAKGDSPLPQPQATKCAGWENRNFSGGALDMSVLIEMIVTTFVERDALACAIQQFDVAGFSVANAAYAS